MINDKSGQEGTGAAESQPAPGPREWWYFVPEEQRKFYEDTGLGRPQKIAGKTALLVIDATYAFTGTRPAPIGEAIKEFKTSCGEVAWAALACIQRLLIGFRSANLPVVFTRSNIEARAAGWAATKRGHDDEDVALWRRGNEFPEMVRPIAGEFICEKARASGFYGTPLTAYLQTQGVRSVVVCGGSTSGCVRASAVDAYSAGFQVFMAEDACFDRIPFSHLANLFDLHAKYATVLTTEEIVAQITQR